VGFVEGDFLWGKGVWEKSYECVKSLTRKFTISSLKTRSQVTITNAYVALINFLLASTV